MLGIELKFPPATNPQILCLGAHSDDIEIGCGGTILRLVAQYPNLSLTWIVFSATPTRAAEAAGSAEAFLAPAAAKKIIIKEFPDGFFPYSAAEIKRYFETLKRRLNPDLIFTHCRNDRHQDHRLLHELTWNTFRQHLILEYEIPKYDGDLGQPNLFVELSQAVCDKKIEILLTHFQSQTNKYWFNRQTFLSLLQIRGLEARAASGYAEGFYGRKMILS
ncbi:MAG: PIG-L deacetylase family protein [Ardenticatenaceae bacterium]|nr:PIG-L deacetylase family protein [Ardenticatenaceae bacterium]